MDYPLKDYLLLKGRSTNTASQKNYTRLLGPTQAQFVEFLTPSPVQKFGTPEITDFFVPILSPLYFSDYAPPSPPQAASTGPIAPRPPVTIGGRPQPVLRPQYLGSDGTVLKVTTTSGQVTMLSGTSKSNDIYELKLETSSGNGPGRQKNTHAVWSAARITITKNGDGPLVFSIGYCPMDDFASVTLSYQNIETGILIDFGPLTVDANGNVIGQAQITRELTYYERSFSHQTEGMPAASTDPQMYLPMASALWRIIDRIEFFAPALELLVSRTASNLPALPRPMAPLSAMQAFTLTPNVKLLDYIAQQTAWIGSALGPLTAEFVSPIDPSSDGLKSAALWLGWALSYGSGKADFDTALTAAYNAYQTLLSEGGPSGGGPTQKPTVKPVSAGDGPFQRAIDALFGQAAKAKLRA